MPWYQKGDKRIHVNGPYPAIKEFLDEYYNEGHIPFCSICGKPVNVGGQIDQHFPWDTTGNRCSKHKGPDLDIDKLFESLGID